MSKEGMWIIISLIQEPNGINDLFRSVFFLKGYIGK